jgi:choline dehydrogenase-like flavoprotein
MPARIASGGQRLRLWTPEAIPAPLGPGQFTRHAAWAIHNGTISWFMPLSRPLKHYGGGARVQEYHYIIAGAGASGCALTNRLVADPANKVLLIEAGPTDRNPMIHMPMGFPMVLSRKEETWNYPSDPKDSLPESFWVRGRVLGGSSSVNGQVYMRGRPADYDGLAIPGWGWREVGKAFEEIEDHELGPAPGRGAGGPLKITLHPDKNLVCDALIAAVAAAGAAETPDLNQEDGIAVGYLPRNIYRGRRQSAAVAFLNPVRAAPNLTIVTNTEVTRLVFEGKRAVGVEVQDKNGTRVIRAQKEIILCAGALNTPKILMLSGIGPAPTLQKYGIEIVVDAPQVGQNLVEQLGFMPLYRLTHGSLNHKLSGIGLLVSVAQYFLTRRGLLGNALFHLGALLSTEQGATRPNAIFQFMTGSAALDHEKGKIEPEKLPGATLSAYIIKPKSRGYLTIVSADPTIPPYFNPNYLTHEDDRRQSIALLRLVRKIFSHPAVKKFGFEEVTPGPSVETDEQILAYFKKSGSLTLHALGTCRMGVDETSVVDSALRVRGVDGLRVADISILPEMVSPHTNAPAMMIGWRAGQIIGDTG